MKNEAGGGERAGKDDDTHRWQQFEVVVMNVLGVQA